MRSERTNRGRGLLRRGALALALAGVAVAAACTPGPRPVQYGAEECAQCRMAVTEAGFASQLLTRTGKAFTFDSVECMAAFVNEGTGVAAEDVHSTWVQDFADHGAWLRADRAAYVRGGEVRSPMGSGLTAHATAAAAREHAAAYGGTVMGWMEVLELEAREGHHGHAHAH